MSIRDQGRSLALCLTVSACLLSGTLASGDSHTQQHPNYSHNKWAAKNLKDYQYTFNWACFCPPEHNKPVVVTVRNGVVSAVKYADGSGAVDKTKYASYKTIEGLFEFLQDAINRNAYRIEVSYDATLGFPTLASIDYDQRVSDEEMSFKAGSLVAEVR